MKNASRKIITSVLTLVLTIVALGTTTFAWFSLSTVSNVSNIEGTITAGDGLEVRLVTYKTEGGQLVEDKSTPWKSNLNETDVSDFIEKIFGEKFLSAVTTTDLTYFTKAGISQTSGKSVLGVEALANTDYIQFKVEFRSQKEGTVALTDLKFNLDAGLTFKPDGEPYVQYTGGTESNYPVITHAAYGARVAIGNKAFQYGEGDPINLTGENAETYQIEGNTIMGEASVNHGQTDFLATAKGITYYDSATESVEQTSGTLMKAYTSVSETVGEDTPYEVSEALDGSAGDYTVSFDVYIWIEGWDADTYDSIYNGVLNVSLTFKKID